MGGAGLWNYEYNLLRMEWVSNVKLGPSGEAHGFSAAASAVEKEIANYIEDYGLQHEYDIHRLKIWITGYSRAGAVANLVAKRLSDTMWDEDKYNEIFTYTCEAPKGGLDEAEKYGSRGYNFIHNMINKVDIVPYVAPEQMGFKRYGVDHYIPGTDAYVYDNTGVVPNDWDNGEYVDVPAYNAGQYHEIERTVYKTGAGAKTVTTSCDNLYVPTKSTAYNAQREKMLVQLKAIDPSITFNDSFRPMTTDILRGFDTHRQGYDDARNTIEIYIDDFINFVQVGYRDYDQMDAQNSMISSREYYANAGPQDIAQSLLKMMQQGAKLNIVTDIDSYGVPYININFHNVALSVLGPTSATLVEKE